MNAKQFVLALRPNARAFNFGGKPASVCIYANAAKAPLGTGTTEKRAWANAANNLKRKPDG